MTHTYKQEINNKNDDNSNKNNNNTNTFFNLMDNVRSDELELD